jgi:c-di-GMP-binding flagellar brake protein YcgR
MFQNLLKSIYLNVPFIRPFIKIFLKEENRRLFERHSIRKLSDVHLEIKLPDSQTYTFFLRDISLGGLSFFIDSNHQVGLLKPGSFVDIKMTFLDSVFTGKFRVAYIRSGMCGCQSIDKRIEYKKFVTEKMSDLLVKSDEFN